MKVFSHLKTIAASLFCLALLCGSASADFNASQFVSGFNGTNGGKGFVFSGYTMVNAEEQLTGTMIDYSAYNSGKSTGGSSYMRTFCIEPDTPLAGPGYALLNYSNGQTTTTSNVAVTIGAAWLYSQFATGNLDNFNYTNSGSRNGDSAALRSAIQHAMNLYTDSATYDWSGNRYLSLLLDINPDKNYWMGAYDPNQRYDAIGDYAVFAMNVYSGVNYPNQDLLYVVKAEYGNGGGGDVPEPATILLWSLGSLGAAGAAWRKRRNQKLQLA